MGVLTDVAQRLGHVGQAFLDLADRPGTFKLPRDLGNTPAQIVSNASTPKVPLTLMMPHEVAAKHDFLSDYAYDTAKAHVDKMAANMNAKGNPMGPDEYARRLDAAHAANLAQHKKLQLLGNDQNYLLTTPHGWAAITTPDLSDPTRTAIEALSLNSSGAPGGGGANAYQALLALTRQQGLTNVTKELTPENVARKPMNLLSHIARVGDTSHLELDPSFWNRPGFAGFQTPTQDEFSQLSVPEQLGYLANVNKETADHALTKSRFPYGLDTFQGDSMLSPTLVGRDYHSIDPKVLSDLLGRVGPDYGVGDTALRQGMLTNALNGQYDLMGSGTPAFKTERLPQDFTQGLMYAEGGQVQDPHEGMTHTAGPTPVSIPWLDHVLHRAAHPFAPDVMAETVKNLKDQMNGLSTPEGATDFINPTGAEGKLLSGMVGAVKPKGGNWFPMQLNDYIGNGVELGGNTHPAVKQWAETQLPRYLKTYLGTAEDPLLQVEKEGNLHLPIRDIVGGGGDGADLAVGRVRQTDPHYQLTGRTTRTPWEQLADAQVTSGPVGESLQMYKDMMGPSDFRLPDGSIPHAESDMNLHNAVDPYHKQFAWAETADPSTQVWDTSFFSEDDPLQFNHVKDYLQHAVTTHATNPADPLALNPESLSKLSVADAVRKTAAWDRANAAQAQSEKLAPLLAKPGKDYPTGWRWSTLQGPEDVDLASQVGQGNGWCFGSPSTAKHYLDKGSKLHVLTDPEGKPQVTVEEGLTARPGDQRQEVIANNAGYVDELRRTQGDDAANAWITEQLQSMSPKTSLSQIKGRFNGKPDEAALPYVQDFVKRGIDDSMTAGEGWGGVSDLGHTGLSKLSNYKQYVQDALRPVHGEYVTDSAMDEYLNAQPNYGFPVSTDEPAMASGGLVHTTDPLHAILHAYYADTIGA